MPLAPARPAAPSPRKTEALSPQPLGLQPKPAPVFKSSRSKRHEPGIQTINRWCPSKGTATSNSQPSLNIKILNGKNQPQSPTRISTFTYPQPISQKRPTLRNYFAQGTDIIFATEVYEKLTVPFVYGLAPELAFRHIIQHPHNGEIHGTAIFIARKVAPYATKQPHLDNEGLTCSDNFQIPGQPPIDLICVYTPPKDKPRRANVEQVLSTSLHHSRHPLNASTITTAYDSTKPPLCGGDFNAILQDHLDAKNLQSKHEWPWLSKQILPTPSAQRTLTDNFRFRHRTSKEFTRFPSPTDLSET